LGGTSSDLGAGGTSVGGSLPVSTTETGGVTVGTGGTLATGGASGTGGASTGKPYGAECTVSAECAGLICVDKVCCSSACNGLCQACDATGACQTVAMREDDSCKTDATGTRMCNAQGLCSVPHLLRDVNPISYTLNGVTNTNPSTPRYFTEGPDRRVYFSASDGTAGEELWATDGMAGTVLVADILAGSSNSSPRGLVNAGVNLYFSAIDSAGYPRLYATNGTAAGTHLVKDIGNNSFPTNSLSALNAGNMIYFPACNASAGCELWRSSGTDAETFMVADIMNTTVNATSTQTFGSNPSELALMSNIVYFRAASAIVGLGTTNIIADYELWRSDGIAANTVRVADIEPGLGNGMPTYLTPMQTLNGPMLLFAASQGASNQELYFTNGTVGSFSSVDIYPGAIGSYPGPFVPMGNRVYFQATDPTNGGELWVTDGTPAGTRLVKDVYVGAGSSSPSLLNATGNYLYFRANDGTGYALWRTDGTDAGTSKVFSAFTPAGSTLFQIQGFGNRAFMCTAGSGTQELWVTDGTKAGTYVTCPDKTKPCGTPFPSNPSDMTSIGGRLYFNATALPLVGGSLGAEPYVYP
jgi:trimeric autotransporter adhesin